MVTFLIRQTYSFGQNLQSESVVFEHKAVKNNRDLLKNVNGLYIVYNGTLCIYT